MCGIAGVWGQADEETVSQMMARLTHRGPDGTGLWSKGQVAFGHCRLAIMDPAGGRQPLKNEDGSVVVIANGEIYNYPSLFRLLRERHTFRTRSDSEVLAHLYEEKGSAMVPALDGMFAFALTDGERLLLARDPIGIKPLYCGIRKQGQKRLLLFASEMKALTPFADAIYEFPPGCYYDSDTGLHRYYTVPDHAPKELPLQRYLQLLRQTLEEAVVKRLMSDVPLGVFLSGGLDSSIIAALARRHMGELHTFAVGIEGSHDLEAARLVAKHIGSVHHEYIFTVREVLDELPRIIYYLESFDQDLVRSAIPSYFCSRLASGYVKVILSGEGADELFASYAYYKGIRDLRELHRELRRSVTALHNINLQRVDRMTMAHGIEGRVPFLDKAMIDLCLRIPPQWKLYRDKSGRLVEKWCLRKAFEDLLPPEIVWRDKAQFDEGSGTVQLLDRALKAVAERFDAAAYTEKYPNAKLRSAEEYFYYRVFMDVFDRPNLLSPNIGRWSQRSAKPLTFPSPLMSPFSP